MHTKLKIMVNGEAREIGAQTLADALRELGVGERKASGIAAARNGEVVPRAAWSDTELRDGDSLEVIGATQGG